MIQHDFTVHNIASVRDHISTICTSLDIPVLESHVIPRLSSAIDLTTGKEALHFVYPCTRVVLVFCFAM